MNENYLIKLGQFFVLFLVGVIFSQAQMIQGKVTLKGTPPPDRVIPGAQSVKDCHSNEIKTEFWKVGTNGGLANVVVWVEGVSRETKPSELLAKVVIDQQGCHYVPHITAVQAKEKFVIQNSDPTLHNVRANQMLKGKKKVVFNLAQPVKGMKSEVSFSEPGLYSLECDVHPWMQSWVWAMDSPFYAVTDQDGFYQLPKGLPAGDYEVKAWHERFLKPLSQKIKLANKTEEINFEFVLESTKGHN
ncbi:MAG: hypothetical protein K1X66_00245 [Verrucomicrobiae bacterium]|nr:hypothetical protein [Verrucomicrobiae bacterium]